MENSLRNRCELFIENRDIIKSEFKWESAYIYPLCAWLYTSQDNQVEINKLRNCNDLLKQTVGIFSNFRGVSKMATVTMLALTETPKENLENMLTVYNKLKNLFWGSEQLVIAASIIAENVDYDEYDNVVKKTREIYEKMKELHPILTSSEDTAFAAMMVISGLDDDIITEEMEKCYQILKSSYFSKNAVQSVSHVLALGEQSAEIKCEKFVRLYEYLKDNGYKYGKYYELATLGVLALLDVDISTIANNIMEVDDFLKTQKGFGIFGIGSKQRLMYAAMLTMSEYVPNEKVIGQTALSGVVAVIIAQQVAVYASIAAASSAAAASSSSSS